MVLRTRLPVHITRRALNIMGIETSCDDTCVAIVNAERQVLASRRRSYPRSNAQLRGISPGLSAAHHRANIDALVAECLQESRLRASELDAIAATTTPGLVICLKVGVDKAIAMCRDNRVPFIPVHHMRAHALVARMTQPKLEFPFLALLISGAHSLICLMRSVDEVELLGESLNISPGGAIDKVARAADIKPHIHYGASVERLAKSAASGNGLAYVTRMPRTSGADFDFGSIRDSFLNVLKRNKDVDIASLCQNLQLIVCGHMCAKLDIAIRYIDQHRLFGTSSNGTKSLVVAGGVAANVFVRSAVDKVSRHHDYSVFTPPIHLVTDNAIMIAWTAVELLNTPAQTCDRLDVPTSVYVHARSPIGEDTRANIHVMPKTPKLRISALMPNDTGNLFQRSE